MWEIIVGDQNIPEFKLTQNIDKLNVLAKDVRFIVLIGSGAGDQYIFQGSFNLGYGLSKYNLAIYSLWPAYHIMPIRGGISNRTTEQNGLVLLQQLIETLPFLPHGSRHSLTWLKEAALVAKRYPYW